MSFYIRTIFTVSVCCLFPWFSYAQEEQDLVTSEDLDLVIGQWQGTLTYTDYQSGRPYAMPVEATIAAGKKPGVIVVDLFYPDEPKANSQSKLTISKDGSKINKQAIVSRILNTSGEVEIISEEDGKDDNRKARIRHTYLLGESRFIIRKEVKFTEQDNWLVRNEFSYRRIR